MAYMFVPDEIAGKLEIINDVCKIKNEDIKKVIDDMSKEENYMTENLQENSLRFKLFAKDIAKKYKESVESEVDSIDKIWEECESKREDAYNKTKEMKKLVEESEKEIGKLKQSIESINFYGMNRAIELIEKFQRLSDSDKEIIIKLAEISK